jgi:sialate O-acetylesterase
MALELSKSKDGIKYIADSENENIRFYYAPHVYFKGDKKREVGKWVTSNPNTVGRFSAVAYHFAVKLQQDLKVPVGIILCYKGGTPAESWMSKEVLEAKGFHDVYTFFEKKIPANYEEEYQKFLDDSKAYKEAEKAGNKPAAKPSEPNGWRNYKRPDGLYYLMLKPIIPYTVKGFLWYQAEANAPRYEQYKTLFPALIEEWRTEFNTFSKNEQHNENAPFIFAQLPPYNHPSYDYPAWALQREAQYYVANTVPNTSMVVTIDVGEKNDIHPLDKYPVGYRMALAAEGTTYNYNIVYKSPQLIDTKIDGNKIELTFDLFGSKSLEIANNEKNIKGFEISNKTGIFVDAVALIKDNNKIVVYSESIDSPVDVRYGWANWVEVNLTNSEGLWVSPFRIDKKIKQ